MKKNKRVGMLMDKLLQNPCRLFESRHFCDNNDIAKSILSEDIRFINEILKDNGSGRLESNQGGGGGVRHIPGVSPAACRPPHPRSAG